MIARARTRRGRVRQTAQWLRHEFAPAFPVSVKWKVYLPYATKDHDNLTKKDIETGYHGWIVRGPGRRFFLSLSLRACPTVSEAIETLLHEWAHAVAAKLQEQERTRISDHDDEFWLVYGRIYRAFHENDGWLESRKYRSGEKRQRKRMTKRETK